MKRSVQFFIQKGIVRKEAEKHAGTDNFGRIEVINLANPLDTKTRMTVYTHFRHSFRKKLDGTPIQFDVDKEVYFFLVPMEYLFADDKLPASDDTPFLAVNVNATYPFISSKNNNAVKRHPCTTGTTIVGDENSANSTSELPMSVFLLNPMILNNLFPASIPKDTRWFYGINDYGEFTIIQTGKDVTIEPWQKILLKPFDTNTNEKFLREYSPKLAEYSTEKGKKFNNRLEFQILKQAYLRDDEDWKWEIDRNMMDFPPYKP